MARDYMYTIYDMIYDIYAIVHVGGTWDSVGDAVRLVSSPAWPRYMGGQMSQKAIRCGASDLFTK